jgi:class 3 adenylate cyclase
MSEDTSPRARRRFAAILVAGYARLLPGDEKEHFAELRRFLTGIVEPQIVEFGGNIFKETAELVLADFDDVIKATRCAAGLRDAVAEMNQALPEEERIVMRIGINLGDGRRIRRRRQYRRTRRSTRSAGQRLPFRDRAPADRRPS